MNGVIGERVLVVGQHPHAGKTGTATEVSYPQGNVGRMVTLEFDDGLAAMVPEGQGRVVGNGGMLKPWHRFHDENRGTTK